METYVVEVRRIDATRVDNNADTANIFFTNATADVLTYCAPRKGAFSWTTAFEADDMIAAIYKGRQILTEQMS